MSDNVNIPSPHAEAAKALIEKIRALRAEVPRLVIDVTLRERRRLVPNASLPQEFLESAGSATQRSDRLAIGAGADVLTLRDAYAFALAYEAVARELKAFANAVTHTIRVQRAAAGKSALDVLAIAKRLSQQPDGGDLLLYVEDMQQKRGRKRRKLPTPEAEGPVTPDAARR